MSRFHHLSRGIYGVFSSVGGWLVEASTRGVRWWESSTSRPPVGCKLLKINKKSGGKRPPVSPPVAIGPYAGASRTVAPLKGAYRLASGKVRS